MHDMTESFEETNIPEHMLDHKMKAKEDIDGSHSDVGVSLPPSTHYDSLNETTSKYGTLNSAPKKSHRNRESSGKTGWNKTENRSRHGAISDVRWNHVGNIG